MEVNCNCILRYSVGRVTDLCHHDVSSIKITDVVFIIIFIHNLKYTNAMHFELASVHLQALKLKIIWNTNKNIYKIQLYINKYIKPTKPRFIYYNKKGSGRGGDNLRKLWGGRTDLCYVVACLILGSVFWSAVTRLSCIHNHFFPASKLRNF